MARRLVAASSVAREDAGIGTRMALALMLVVIAMLLTMRAGPAAAQEEKRLGLVIGNAEYVGGALATSANDAGLIAQTLQASGFDVMGARDLDGDALRNTFRDFVDKVAAEGPGTVAFVYLAGHGVQYEGENYFVPIDAKIERDVDVPLRALRISDYIRPLAALKAKAVIVVLDAARDAPFAKAGQPLAGGLALVEPMPGIMWAFNAAPGTIAAPGNPPYGAYAQALAEMMREGGVPLGAVFERTRLRVHDATSGAEVPWHASQVKAPFVFFERAADAPVEVSFTSAQTRRERPIQAFDDAREAYLAALERDTLQGYLDFLRAYPDHPQAKRVRAIVAARREAITWRRTRNADTPEAYWSYLDRYPNGPHAFDARRRLAFLTAPPEPPPRYRVYEYDIPPPPPEEIIYVRRPYVYFADPVYAFVAPPPPPIYFLPPPLPVYYFAPPPPPVVAYVLPVPVFVPVPIYVRQVVYVRAPPETNVVYRNIHTPVANTPNFGAPVQRDGPAQKGPPQGGLTAPAAGVSPGTVAAGAAVVGAGAAAAAVALPPSVQKRAATTPPAGPAGVTKTGVPVQPGVQQLPGVTGVPPTKGAVPPQSGRGPGPGVAVTPPPTQQLPGSAKGAPLPPVPGKSGPTILPPPGQVSTPKGPTPPGQPTGTPSAPRSVTVTPPPPGKAPGVPPLPKSPQPAMKTPATPPGTIAQPPATPRQQRVERAQEDRASVQQKLQQDRQRDLDRRRQEQDAQRNARQQNQMQDLQRQRQQQMDAQRQQMQQQRAQQQQQQQQQQMQRQQQMQQQQQQAAQAAARAQAEAAARARAAQQQQQRPKCGAPGLPPCPR